MHPSARLVDFTEAGTAGAGGVQAIVGALHDEFADELREDVEDQAPPGVVVLSA